MQVYTPWQYLGRGFEFPITVVGSGDPSLSRPLGDPWAEDSWFAVRDPSGEIRRGLEGVGDLKGDTYLNENLLKLLVQRLTEDGNTAKYVRLTNSTHSYVSEKDMPMLVGLIVPRTTQ